MSIFYSLTIELVSERKFSKKDLDSFKDNLESRISNPGICEILYDNSSINFNSFIEVYAEDRRFELDIVADIEELVKNVEDLIPGGWSKDSKIEFFSNSPRHNTIWYKEGKVWKEAETEADEKGDYFLGEDEWDSDFYEEDYLEDI